MAKLALGRAQTVGILPSPGRLDEKNTCGAKGQKKIYGWPVLLLLCIATLSNAEENPLVNVQSVIPDIQLEIRYATDHNFMKEVLYSSSSCFLRKETAAKLKKAQTAAKKLGYGLKLYDGYRPLSVQKKMWAHTPIEGYVANPAKGSNHNRGAAVDLTLVDSQGRELPMPSDYDEFSKRSHREYAGGTPQQKDNRKILERLMEQAGFKGLKTEWWHFDDTDAKKYPVLDVAFEDAISS